MVELVPHQRTAGGCEQRAGYERGACLFLGQRPRSLQIFPSGSEHPAVRQHGAQQAQHGHLVFDSARVRLERKCFKRLSLRFLEAVH